MAIKIRVPDKAYSRQNITLSGDSFDIIFKYNVRDDRWYFDLKDEGGNLIFSGIKVMPNQNLTGRYVKDEFNNGNLWCFRRQKDDGAVSRNNFGIGKSFELAYLTKEEELETGLDGVIQLQPQVFS